MGGESMKIIRIEIKDGGKGEYIEFLEPNWDGAVDWLIDKKPKNTLFDRRKEALTD